MEVQTPDDIEAAIHKQSDTLVELINYYLLEDKSHLKFVRTWFTKKLIVYFDLEFNDCFTRASPCRPKGDYGYNNSQSATLEVLLENTDIAYVKKVFLSKGWKLSFHNKWGQSSRLGYFSKLRIQLTQVRKPLETFPQLESKNPYR